MFELPHPASSGPSGSGDQFSYVGSSRVCVGRYLSDSCSGTLTMAPQEFWETRCGAYMAPLFFFSLAGDFVHRYFCLHFRENNKCMVPISIIVRLPLLINVATHKGVLFLVAGYRKFKGEEPVKVLLNQAKEVPRGGAQERI